MLPCLLAIGSEFAYSLPGATKRQRAKGKGLAKDYSCFSSCFAGEAGGEAEAVALPKNSSNPTPCKG